MHHVLHTQYHTKLIKNTYISSHIQYLYYYRISQHISLYIFLDPIYFIIFVTKIHQHMHIKSEETLWYFFRSHNPFFPLSIKQRRYLEDGKKIDRTLISNLTQNKMDLVTWMSTGSMLRIRPDDNIHIYRIRCLHI